MIGKTYAEPFAGGAGLALKLLLNNDVEKIIINDIDPAIYSFWYSILNSTEEFCRLVDNTNVNVKQWEEEKVKYSNPADVNTLELGFATFFLNRTNISGVIKGGMIGGLKQDGNYKINARYNKKGLTDRIRKIASEKSRITISNYDVNDFLDSECLYNKRGVFINFDPPYVKKGSQLYENSFCVDDHRKLSRKVAACKRKWIVTYDICDLTKALYEKYRSDTLDISYSIGSTREAKEYIFYSDNLDLPDKN
jgi:DNA adenine methylase